MANGNGIPKINPQTIAFIVAALLWLAVESVKFASAPEKALVEALRELNASMRENTLQQTAAADAQIKVMEESAKLLKEAERDRQTIFIPSVKGLVEDLQAHREKTEGVGSH